MIRIFKLVVLLVISQVAFGQAPSNYTNINGRYRWIAGMFDSTFHIPKGSTPSLRTGGSTNSGGLFYNTSDSSVYTYTGTQWIKVRGSINPSDTTNKYVTQVYKKNASDSVFYVKGGNHIWAFNDSTGSPGGGGGGKVYYFNGGVNMGTIGGIQMYELGDTANTGAAANFTRSTTGNIANFITDAGKPGLVQIPAGVWSVDAWLSETGGGSNHAEIWIEVEKWDGSTITTIATSPIEQITEGATPNLYSWSVTIPTTSLTITDRIVIQFYISNTNGKTVTLYTQNGYVGEVHTTFTTGIGAINGLTAPAQYLVTGTSGTDFNINSTTATHTFNLPTASATNRGALSSANWSTFNSKIGPSDTASMLSPYLRSNVAAATYVPYTGATTNVNLGVRTLTASSLYIANTNALFGRNAANNSDYSLIGITGADKVYIDAGNLGTTIGGSLTLATLNNATVDTDAFLVSDAGVVKYRTGAQLLSDIGGASSSSISGTTNYIPKFTSSSAIGNSIMYEGTNAIGIGTSSPTSIAGYTILSVNNATTGGIFETMYNGTPYGRFFTASTNYVGLISVQNVPLILGTNDTERLRISSTGLVGIGTSAPTQKLDVVISSGPYNSRFYNSSTSTSEYNVLLFSQGASGSATGYLGTGGSAVGGAFANNFVIGTQSNNALVLSTNDFERLRISSTGKIGIGTSSPTELLHISGTNPFIKFTNTSTTAGGLFFTGSGDAYVVYAASSNSIITGTVAGSLAYRTANKSQLWSVDGGSSASMTLDASGNLGLGVTPSAWSTSFKTMQISNRLALSGTAASVYLGNNWFVNTSGSNRYIESDFATLYGQDNGIHAWYTAPSGTAGNAISFTQAMTLDASGNLGIGYTSPSTYGKLAVNGAGYFGNTLTTAGVLVRAVGTNSTTVSSSTLWSDSAPLMYAENRSTTANTAAGYAMQVGGGNAIAGILGIAESTAQAALGFYTGGTGTVAEKVRITSGGNVGIGTTAPTALLTVAGTTDLAWSASTSKLQISRSGTVARLQNYESGSVASLALQWDGGNVGIGTTSPNAKLVIAGTTNVITRITGSDNTAFSSSTFWSDQAPMLSINNTSSSVNTVAGIKFELGNTNAAAGIGAIQETSNSAAGLLFTTGGSSTGNNNPERMRITSGGLVGIGTSAPSVNLQVQSASNTEMRITDGTIGYQMYTGSGSNDFVLGTYTNHNLLFRTNAQTRMLLSAAGELLINTTSDAGDYKLQVNGNVYQTGNTEIINASGPYILLGEGNGANQYGVVDWDATNNKLRIATQPFAFGGSGGQLNLTTAGNVEIPNGSIKTAAPSGGTAKPWKLGEAGVSVGGANTTAVKVEIDGVVYYLLTAYLPEPEPDPAALPSSGPSASYKTYNKPIPVKTTKDVEIDNLKKEIEELKQLIKNK